MSDSFYNCAGTTAFAAMSLLMAPSDAFAQAVATSAEEGPSTVNEIVVTARKREESLLHVPIVATVVSQSQLEQQQVLDLKDVAKFAPGLVLSQTLGVSGVQVSLRA